MSFTLGNVAENWRRWEQQFEVYYKACELKKRDKAVQVAILLHAAGPEAQEIHETFVYEGEDDVLDYKKVLSQFRLYCNPRKNIIYERYLFWHRSQCDGETIDHWVTELKSRAEWCEFGDQKNDMIRDRIVFGITDDRVKERLLRESKLDLAKAIDICHASETSKHHLHAMTGGNTQVNFIRKTHTPKHSTTPGKSKPHNQTPRIKHCRYCGSSHPPRQCPSYGKQCSKCSGWNHFAAVCKGGGFRKSAKQAGSRQKHSVHQIQTESDYDSDDSAGSDLFMGVVFVGSVDSRWNQELFVNKQSVTFKLDTGADANVLPHSVYKRVSPNTSLNKTKTTLTAFGNTKIKPLGEIQLNVAKHDNMSQPFNFFVTDMSDISILGRRACETLNLVSRVPVNSISSVPLLTKDKLLAEYSDIFTGLGEYAKEYHIETDPSVPPVIQQPRKVPYAKYEKYKEGLEKLQEKHVIADVDRPTDWVHNLVITEKRNGSLRFCLDPKPLNKSIKRERYEIPTPADVQSRLSGKRLFTVIDMKDGYWHVKLTDESSYLCTFHTPWGRKRFLRMPFGISSASEVMQKRNEEAFGDIPGVYVIADDIIIAATDEAEHDAITHKVMLRARDKNVKFNKTKIQFKVTEVSYMGNKVTANGMMPDPSKIEAIVNLPVPNDRQSLQRLLGMVKYLSTYIPNESAITAPLRMLLKDGVEWNWNHEHDKALDTIKLALTQQPVLKFYDVTKPVTIQTDASKDGLRSCLLQDKQPVAFASRALTSAEKNYSQIEKELLAICFACEKFHQYIYGKEVEIHSDHRPLESILKKPISKASPRLQRMMLRLQRYNYNVVYVRGKYLFLADTLSRAFIQGDPKCGAPDDMEVMVHSLVHNIPASPDRLNEIRQVTADDETLQKLKRTIQQGWPRKRQSILPDLVPYWNIRDELHEADGLIFFGERLIIPHKLQHDMLELIHESHLGAEKCKARARSVMYWPGMAADIEATVSKCSICLRYRASNVKQPLQPHSIPSRPWQKIGADIMTYKGHDYLVAVDYYSKYPELAKLESKTATSCMMHLKSMFARHGIPETIVTDNMPFASQAFIEFTKDWGITLTTSSPTFPQSNGQSERAVQTMKRILKKADDESKDPYLALLEYRNTPISGTSFSPAQMLMSRMLRSKLPNNPKLLQPAIVDPLPELDQRQQKYKYHHDKSAKELSELSPGDVVRIQRNKRWEPALVVDKHQHPRSYIVDYQGQHLRRNRKHLLKTSEPPPIVFPQYDHDSGVNPSQQVSAPEPLVVQPVPTPPQHTPHGHMPLRRSTRVGKKPPKYSDYVCK